MNNQEGSNNYNSNEIPVTNSLGQTGTSEIPMNTQVVSSQMMNQVQNYQTPVQPQQNYNGMYYNNVPPKERNITRLLVIIIAAALVVIVAVLLTDTLNKKETQENSNHTGTRTIMVYMVGSDLESSRGAATVDLLEMKLANVNLTDVNVVVYVGGAKRWKNGYENNSIYELKNSGFELVHKDSERSMGDPTTLSYFLNYAKEHYQTDLYDLILWDHGAGPILGYGQDEVYNDRLYLKEITDALNNSAFANEKLEFIGFDACLMASIEVASELRNYAYYLVASQEVEPVQGWNYEFLGKINREVDSVSIGKMIIDDYFDYYNKHTTAFGSNYDELTLSIIELGKVGKVTENINLLFADLENKLNQGGYSLLVNQITRARAFGVTSNGSYDLLDLYDVALQLENDNSSKIQDLKKSLENAVIYQRANSSNAYGISIYYPYSTTTNLSAFLGIYNQLDFSQNYQRFLNTYSRTLLGDRIITTDFSTVKPAIVSNGEQISANLDTAVLEHYHKSNYVIFRDMKDGYYMPVYRSSDTTLNSDGTLIANFDKKQLVVTDEKGEVGWASMYEYSRTEDYVIYEVPALLMNITETMESKSVMIRLRVDNGSKSATIVGAIAKTQDGFLSGREEVDLSQWEFIQFFNSKYKILDANGNYTDNWESGGTYYLTEVSTKENYKIEFQDLEKEYDYYCLFMIQDTQGNIHTTNLVKIN